MSEKIMTADEFVELTIEFLIDLNDAMKKEDNLRQELDEPYYFQAWDTDFALDWAWKKAREIGLMKEAEIKRQEQLNDLAVR